MRPKSTVAIRVTKESSAGGAACNWVEKRRDGYYLHSVECGHLGGPYATAVGALGCDGSQFGMAYTSIESSLPAEGFKLALGSIVLEDEDRIFKRPFSLTMAPRTRPSMPACRSLRVAQDC